MEKRKRGETREKTDYEPEAECAVPGDKSREALGTYKSEFEAPIKRYVELRLQYDILNEKWYENDCQITEVYTNKAGAKNQRKTALYLALETMRRELTEMENVLGLTPKGLKLLKTKGLEKKKGGALAEALRKADGEV